LPGPTQPDSALRIGCFAAFGQAKGEVEEEDSMGTCMDNVKIDRDVPCFGSPSIELFTGNSP